MRGKGGGCFHMSKKVRREQHGKVWTSIQQALEGVQISLRAVALLQLDVLAAAFFARHEHITTHGERAQMLDFLVLLAAQQQGLEVRKFVAQLFRPVHQGEQLDLALGVLHSAFVQLAEDHTFERTGVVWVPAGGFSEGLHRALILHRALQNQRVAQLAVHHRTLRVGGRGGGLLARALEQSGAELQGAGLTGAHTGEQRRHLDSQVHRAGLFVLHCSIQVFELLHRLVH
mmetsp:Transcript_41895/g.72798  ORF Transcript_41895/g.72798 Transcript_41895/m.72798 type:complete len:230 (-) Transcript_41895:474-1163(-)